MGQSWSLVLDFLALLLLIAPAPYHRVAELGNDSGAHKPYAAHMVGIGTGVLALPVLAGSAANASGEVSGWWVGLSRKRAEANGFYATIAVVTALARNTRSPAATAAKTSDVGQRPAQAASRCCSTGWAACWL